MEKTQATGENPFELQDEIFFICYDEIIKNPYPFLLNKINTTTLKDAYKPFIDVDRIAPFNKSNLLTFVFQRQYLNILEELAIRPFDFNSALDELKNRYLEMYIESPVLTIGKSMRVFLREKTVKQIYIYTPTYDKRVEFDIYKTYDGHKKINYVYGDIVEAINQLDKKPTAYFLNDIGLIYDLAEDKSLLEYTQLLLADYRFNYVLDDENVLEFRFEIGEVIGDEVPCKFATFSPFTIEEKHINQFVDFYGIEIEEQDEEK